MFDGTGPRAGCNAVYKIGSSKGCFKNVSRFLIHHNFPEECTIPSGCRESVRSPSTILFATWLPRALIFAAFGPSPLLGLFRNDGAIQEPHLLEDLRIHLRDPSDFPFPVIRYPGHLDSLQKTHIVAIRAIIEEAETIQMTDEDGLHIGRDMIDEVAPDDAVVRVLTGVVHPHYVLLASEEQFDQPAGIIDSVDLGGLHI